jgi:hypothetical protein
MKRDDSAFTQMDLPIIINQKIRWEKIEILTISCRTLVIGSHDILENESGKI